MSALRSGRIILTFFAFFQISKLHPDAFVYFIYQFETLQTRAPLQEDGESSSPGATNKSYRMADIKKARQNRAGQFIDYLFHRHDHKTRRVKTFRETCVSTPHLYESAGYDAATI